jgi:hypothetical protein
MQIFLALNSYKSSFLCVKKRLLHPFMHSPVRFFTKKEKPSAALFSDKTDFVSLFLLFWNGTARHALLFSDIPVTMIDAKVPICNLFLHQLIQAASVHPAGLHSAA